jgi:hypothetical protein
MLEMWQVVNRAALLSTPCLTVTPMPARSDARSPRRTSVPIPITRERALMDLARLQAERDHDRPRRPLWLTIVAALVAICVVLVVGRGFDAFLGGFQRLLERIAREEAQQEARKPQPIFVVPPEEQPAQAPVQKDEPSSATTDQ